MMNLKVGLISRDEALKISPHYVAFIEGDFNSFSKVEAAFSGLKTNQKVITFHDGQFFEAKVSKVDHNSYQAVDGPVVRVSNGEYSWRVDGDRYAYPILT